MPYRVAFVVGAGATLADSERPPEAKRPPLDKGFFHAALRAGASGWGEARTVVQWFKTTYEINLTSPEHDSLEKAMTVLYTDMYNPQLRASASSVFRTLLKVFNFRLASTTNRLNPTRRSLLYRILCYLLNGGFSADEVAIITFNQDIQIEKALDLLDRTQRYAESGPFLNFPHCYRLALPSSQITSPTSSGQPVFQKGDPKANSVALLKLHGSLNWYSRHLIRNPSPKAMFNSHRKLYLTSRSQISTQFRVRGKRTLYSLPVVVPPVTHKSGILHDGLRPVWSEAEQALGTADAIIVFGYSCAPNDFESANMFQRAVRGNANCHALTVIDPDSGIPKRYADLTQVRAVHYYTTAGEFLRNPVPA